MANEQVNLPRLAPLYDILDGNCELHTEGAGKVALWCEVLKVDGPLVTFRHNP